MAAVGQPCHEPDFGFRHLTIGDAHFLEAEFDAPLPDIPRERREIDFRRATNRLLHSPDNKPPDFIHYLPAEADTLALGAAFAAGLAPGLVIYLQGDLGAGKTTFARGVLRGLGYVDKVRSPTYALVELYKFSKLYLYHFDFYRFEDPRELDDAGFRECFTAESVALVEWPQKAATVLPAADVTVSIRSEADGRLVEIKAHTEAGRRCIEQLQYG
jgi:tRNA threonylcarbamoyladenosine biosynthesis protein TsaE